MLQAKRNVVFTFILVAGFLGWDTPSRADANCDRITSVYQSCGANLGYDGRDFAFSYDGLKKTVMCDDGRKLDFFDRVDAMDVSSIFMYDYTPGVEKLPEVRLNYDAGRLRVEELLKSIYGSNAAKVRSHLVKVPFLNQKILFNENLGAALALEAAGKDLAALIKSDASAAKFLKGFTTGKLDLRGSTFDWRVVLGTSRLSAHSFGTAIDLVTGPGPQYWLWDEMKVHPARAKQGEQAYRNIHFIPRGPPIWNWKVVEVMEKHGFIWGAKWNHYDSMHFEYRPEFYPGYQIACSHAKSLRGHFERATEADFAELDRVKALSADQDDD